MPGPSVFVPQKDVPPVPAAFAPPEPHPHGTFSIKDLFFILLSFFYNIHVLVSCNGRGRKRKHSLELTLASLTVTLGKI